MCCGGGCGCGDCTGNILYVSEKIVSFCALTCVVICIMLTLAITMGVGIGTGYNYCFVDQKVQPDHAAKAPSGLRSREEQGELIEQSDSADFRRTPSKSNIPMASVTSPPSDDSYTLAIKLHGNVDFLALIARLRARNKNATLELIT